MALLETDCVLVLNGLINFVDQSGKMAMIDGKLIELQRLDLIHHFDLSETVLK